jgi:hypothetical protein
VGRRYQHDHDEELGMYWFGALAPQSPPIFAPKPALRLDSLTRVESDAEVIARLTNALVRSTRPRRRHQTYWKETGRLVLEYFELRAGADYSDELHDAFIDWLKRSPGEAALYHSGDDMTRADLVDWFLSVVL